MSTEVDIDGEPFKNDYIWLIMQEDTHLDNQPGKFALYSFRDQKIIFW